MIKRLFDQIIDAISVPNPAETGADIRVNAIRKATAVLMLDVALADKVFDQSELDRVLKLTESHFDLAPEDAADLVRMAEDAAHDLVTLHEFIQLLHDNLDNDEKASIISMLWQVAYADGRLDKYEDALILKIGDLLHVNRVRVMRLKHDAQPSAD